MPAVPSLDLEQSTPALPPPPPPAPLLPTLPTLPTLPPATPPVPSPPLLSPAAHAVLLADQRRRNGTGPHRRPKRRIRGRVWTFIKWWFIIKLSLTAIVLMVAGAVSVLDRPDQGAPKPDGASAINGDASPRLSADPERDDGGSVVRSPLIAVVAPSASTVHTRLWTWEAEGSIVIGDGITEHDVHYVTATDSGWYTATDNVSTLTVVKSGDELFLQGIDGTQVWYQLPADESAGDLLWQFDVARVETLADFVPEPTRPFAYLRDNGWTVESVVRINKFKLFFDVAAMRADEAVLQAFDDEWDFDPAADWVESEVGFDSDGIARWSLSSSHESSSLVTTYYRNDLISFGDDPVMFPDVTDPQPLPSDVDANLL